MTKLILIRHGESKWNLENRFTGWMDIDLSKNGILESKKAGNLIKKEKIIFNKAYSSFLKRSIHTLWNILDVIDQQWIKIYKTWRLNERHYGLLQGMNKNYAIKKYGEHKVKIWRRSIREMPPKINISIEEYYNKREIKYSDIKIEDYPNSESLEMTIERIKIIWNCKIIKDLKEKKNILIVAHGNSIRSIMQIMNNFDEKEIISLEIPTGIPYVYEFNENLDLINNYIL